MFLGINAAQASVTKTKVSITITMNDDVAPMDTNLKAQLAQAIRASEINSEITPSQSQQNQACKKPATAESSKRLLFTDSAADYAYVSKGGDCT